MSSTEQQAPHAATPPSEPTPGVSLDCGLSLAQDLLARLIVSLAGVLIAAQITRILDHFEHMMALWRAGQRPNLPPVRARSTTSRAARLRRDFNALVTPGLRPDQATPRLPAPSMAQRRPTQAQAHAPRIPRPVGPLATNRASERHQPPHSRSPGTNPRQPRHLPPPFRFFALQAPAPNCALIVP